MIRGTEGFRVGIEVSGMALLWQGEEEARQQIWLTKYELPVLIRVLRETLKELEDADD